MKQTLWLIALTIWLAFLTWNSLLFWRTQYLITLEALTESQAQALRYARELRAIERKERIVSIKLIEDEPVAQGGE